MNPTIEIRLDPKVQAFYGGVAPKYATDGSAAIDIVAPYAFQVEAGAVVKVNTGIFLNLIDRNLCALLMPRSGAGINKGCILANTVGLIDSDYQGEIIAAVWNRHDADHVRNKFTVNAGERFAQLLFVPIVRPIFRLVSEFSTETARGTGGLGSTGN